MTALDDALGALAGLTAEGCSLEVFAVSREGRGGAGADVDAAPRVTRVLIGASLSDTLRQGAQERAHDLAHRAPRPYTPAGLLARGEVMHTSPLPAVLAGLEDILTTGDVAPYDPSAPYVQHLRLLGSRLTTADGTRLTFWRELRASVRLERSRWVAALWTGDRYVRLEDEHALLLDDRVDAVVVHGVALFTAKGTFERLFDFVEELRRSAAETYAVVTGDLRIEGAAELEAACTSNPAMMAKLASVRRHLDTDPGYRAAVTMDRLVAFVRDHPETEVEISGSGADARLVFHPDRRRYKILKLLDDDYLHSLLTRRSYEANSKSDPLARPP